MPEPAFRVTGIEEMQTKLIGVSAQVRAQGVADGMQAMGNVIRSGMQSRAPRKTGSLRSKIDVNVTVSGGGGIAKIGPIRDAFYGGIIELGSKSHLIRAGAFKATRAGRLKRRGKKVLASAEKVYGRVVQHPGAAPNHWMRDTVQQDSAKAVEACRVAVLASIERAAGGSQAR